MKKILITLVLMSSFLYEAIGCVIRKADENRSPLKCVTYCMNEDEYETSPTERTGEEHSQTASYIHTMRLVKLHQNFNNIYKMTFSLVKSNVAKCLYETVKNIPIYSIVIDAYLINPDSHKRINASFKHEVNKKWLTIDKNVESEEERLWIINTLLQSMECNYEERPIDVTVF